MCASGLQYARWSLSGGFTPFFNSVSINVPLSVCYFLFTLGLIWFLGSISLSLELSSIYLILLSILSFLLQWVTSDYSIYMCNYFCSVYCILHTLPPSFPLSLSLSQSSSVLPMYVAQFALNGSFLGLGLVNDSIMVSNSGSLHWLIYF